MRIYRKFIIMTISIVLITFLISTIYAQAQANSKENSIQQQLEHYTRNIDVNNISKEDILQVYDQINEQYSNDELGNMIEDNAEEIKKQGISEEVISTGANFIRTTDPETVRNIIEKDIDIENIKEKIDQGYTQNEILKSLIQEMPNEKKVEIATKLVLSNKLIRIILSIGIILFIYGTILRWIIYVKAKRHGWAAIVPLYRQIVMYQICGLSPWLMLLWLVPILGWIVMFVVAIMKRFCLADSFGRGSLFGWGLLLLPLIFQSILAFNSNIEKVDN